MIVGIVVNIGSVGTTSTVVVVVVVVMDFSISSIGCCRNGSSSSIFRSSTDLRRVERRTLIVDMHDPFLSSIIACIRSGGTGRRVLVTIVIDGCVQITGRQRRKLGDG